MRRVFNATLIGGCLMVLASGGVAFASGGGGGAPSGGGGPSISGGGPTYDPAAEYAKAIAALKANDYKAAARAAGHVTDAVPTSPDGWRVLGVAKAGDNDWKGSRRAYEKLLKLTPEDPTSHAGLAVALANLKDPKAQTEAAWLKSKAQAELDWLKAKTQACADTCADAPRLKSLSTQVESAMAPAAAGAPKPSALLDRSMLFGGARTGDAAYVTAVSLINERRYDEALASLSQAEAVFGPHPDILTYEGYAWRKKGDYARAESYYRQALAIAPNHVGATEYYGELMVERGDMAGARAKLALLDAQCRFGCAEAEELRHWVTTRHSPHSS